MVRFIVARHIFTDGEPWLYHRRLGWLFVHSLNREVIGFGMPHLRIGGGPMKHFSLGYFQTQDPDGFTLI